jgi:SAM-dependent methyltransferase
MVHEQIDSQLQKHQAWWDSVDARDYDEACAGFRPILEALDDVYLQFCRGRILEVGCGNGRFLSRLRHLGVSTMAGVDLSLGMLRDGARRALPNLVNAPAEGLPFKDASFDTIVAVWSVLKYADRVPALREAHRVVRPGGYVIFDLINYWPALIDALWRGYIRHGKLPRLEAFREYTVAHNMRSARAEAARIREAGLDLVDVRSVRYLPFMRRRTRRLGFWPGYWGALIGCDTMFICRKPAA